MGSPLRPTILRIHYIGAIFAACCKTSEDAPTNVIYDGKGLRRAQGGGGADCDRPRRKIAGDYN